MAIRTITDSHGRPSFVYPATEHPAPRPWIYMVPQYTPSSVLVDVFDAGKIVSNA
jgi:hypothetical protein